MILPLPLNSSTARTMKRISVDCSRLVQPRFLRIPLSYLRLSRIPWTLRRKLRISEAVNLSEAIGYVAFVAWLCYVTTSEPVRKELLSQRVFVCRKNATKNDKVSFVFAVFRGFFFLANGLWVLSLSLCHKAAWILRLVSKVWTSLIVSQKSNCKVILDCIATAKHSIYRQVLGHDSFHGRTLNKNDVGYQQDHHNRLFAFPASTMCTN